MKRRKMMKPKCEENAMEVEEHVESESVVVDDEEIEAFEDAVLDETKVILEAEIDETSEEIISDGVAKATTGIENGNIHRKGQKASLFKKGQKPHARKPTGLLGSFEAFVFQTSREEVLQDVDIITFEASDCRIVWGCSIISFILALSQICLLTWLITILYYQKSPIVLYVDIQNPFDRGFPMDHFAVIKSDGTVLAMTLKKKSPFKMLMKLPFSQHYFGFSDAKGVLYFIDGRMRKSVTAYHKSFGDLGHKTLTKKPKENELIVLDDIYSEGILVGSKYWLFGLRALSNQIYNMAVSGNIVKRTTHVFHRIKEKITNGPKLPKDFIGDFSNSITFCSTSLNRSHIMILGYGLGQRRKVAMIDFEGQKWIPGFPDLTFPMEAIISECDATLLIDKNGKRTVFAHLLLWDSVIYNLESYSHHLLSYDVSLGKNGSWTSLYKMKDQSKRILKATLRIKNIPYSFMNDGSILKQNKDGSWSFHDMWTFDKNKTSAELETVVQYFN